MKPTSGLFAEYFRKAYGASPAGIKVTPLGKGCHGQGFRVEFYKEGEVRRLIVKTLDGGIGLGHDYPSDRAAVFLQARKAYSSLPRHVKALDVLALGKDGKVFSIDGGREYYLVMEEVSGRNYFEDLHEMGGKKALGPREISRVKALSAYLAGIHSKKKDSPSLYLRRIRDTIGHGECLMGVLDTYDGAAFTNISEMAAIEKACVDWRARLKPLFRRLSLTHGDFHPGNLMFGGAGGFRLLDRSRGEYGEPADDLTALSINFVFFSLIEHGRMAGAYDEALRTFYGEYIRLSGDEEVLSAAAPFYAFRGAVVANPLFYPGVDDTVRAKVFGFVHGVLAAERFDPSKVNDYIRSGNRYRKRFF